MDASYALVVGTTLETVLVTGASRGIGAAAARHLASPERRLLLVARDASALKARSDEISRQGNSAVPVAADLGDPAGLRAFLDRIERDFGTPHGLVLNAAVSNNRAFKDTTPDLVEHELRTNYLAPAEILWRFLPGMARRGYGRVVVVGSLTSIVPFPGNASYSASKAALTTLVRGLQFEYRAKGVQIGTVLPGYTDTRMTETLSSLLPPMSPDTVGRAVARCYERTTSPVVPGGLNQAAALMFRLFPSCADRLLARFSRYLIPSVT